MYQPFGSRSAIPAAFLLLAYAFPLHAGAPASGQKPVSAAPAGEAPGNGTQAGAAAPAGAPNAGPVAGKSGEPAPVPSAPVAMAPASVSHAGPTPEQRLLIPPRVFRLKGAPKAPAPLKRLTYSAREGFALRMVSNQDVTAEIRNGAGRTLAYTARNLEPGDWTLRPRNLAPGLYTVLLRTGPNLRVLRLEISDAERGQGGPEWLLEKAADSTLAPGVLPRGARRAPSGNRALDSRGAPAHASALARSSARSPAVPAIPAAAARTPAAPIRFRTA